jgi:hypothetical protein
MPISWPSLTMGTRLIPCFSSSLATLLRGVSGVAVTTVACHHVFDFPRVRLDVIGVKRLILRKQQQPP